MLFHSSIRKELARHFGATVVVLVTVVMTMMLIRTLGIAAQGGVNPKEVMMVMGYMVLGHMPTILTLALFIAIVSTLSRWFTDSEMVVWLSSGLSFKSFVRPLFRFAWPILLGIATLALVIWPWANQQSFELRDRYEKRSDIDRVTPGEFQESAGGKRVFFIDRDAQGGDLGRNVFIASTEGDQETITTAQTGRVEITNNEKNLILNGGQQLAVQNKTRSGVPEIRISHFREYRTRIGTAGSANTNQTPPKGMSTLQLLQTPSANHWGELSWRFGLAVAALNCVLLALVVSYVKPRTGRSVNLMLALFSFVVYYNLINFGQNWIAAGKTPALWFMLGLHGSVTALCLAAMWQRHTGWHWRSIKLRPTGN